MSRHPAPILPETKLVVFDCDGTLVDSAHLIVAAMRSALAQCGITEVGGEAVRRIIGLSLNEAVGALLPATMEAARDVAVSHYRDAYRALAARPDLRPPLFPGVRAMLETLAAGDCLLGIATGKSAQGMRRTLQEHDLGHLFATVRTADDGPGKPHPTMLRRAMDEAGVEPAETVLIGDTTFDVTMARAAGATAVGVAWGYHPATELAAAGALHIVQSCAEVAPLVLARRGDPWRAVDS
ncbi:MAG: HAD-IA family hydrolase [Alphaproteobacteria bacterium]|nr:HAD-IA family hydrolase [Alphaproteobacteria bacterium]